MAPTSAARRSKINDPKNATNCTIRIEPDQKRLVDREPLRDEELLREKHRCDRDHRLDAVVERHVAEQVLQRVRQLPERAKRRDHLPDAECKVRPVARRRLRRRAGAQAPERDDREAAPPHARRRERQPDRHPFRDAQRAGERHEREIRGQEQPAAQVPERIAAAGHLVALILGRDVVQERVVQNNRRAEADVRHDQQRGAEQMPRLPPRRTSGTRSRRPRSRTPPSASS